MAAYLDDEDNEELTTKEKKKLDKKKKKEVAKPQEEYEVFEKKKKAEHEQREKEVKDLQQKEKEEKKGKHTDDNKKSTRKSKPPQPRTPFKLFCADHPSKPRDDCVELWAKLPEAQKTEYKEKAATEKERYDVELKEWEEAHTQQAASGGKKEKRRL